MREHCLVRIQVKTPFLWDDDRDGKVSPIEAEMFGN